MKFETIFVGIMAGFIGSLLTYMIIPKEQIPLKNAVMAFNSAEKCPKGWREFDEAAGRFILAAGSGDELTERKIRDIGGSEKIEQRFFRLHDEDHLSQITKLISLNFPQEYKYEFDKEMIIQPPDEQDEVLYEYIIPDKMPPFIALKFCMFN